MSYTAYGNGSDFGGVLKEQSVKVCYCTPLMVIDLIFDLSTTDRFEVNYWFGAATLDFGAWSHRPT